MKKQLLTSLALTGLLFGSPAHSTLLGAADIVFMVDLSGSMSGEHTWISSMVSSLESELMAAGVGTGPNTNRYALVGFGGGGTSMPGHSIPVGGGTFGTAAEMSTAAGSLIASGGTEDGWDAIDHALGLTYREGAAKNLILITDEDRDNTNAGLSFAGLLSSMISDSFLLNAVINHGFADGNQSQALGMDSEGNAYIADGGGSYTTTSGGNATSGFGTTKADYIDLALDTGGAAWDLNLLRQGGLLANSFTESFVDIKVDEIREQAEVPVPAVPALFAIGLLGMFTGRRKFFS